MVDDVEVVDVIDVVAIVGACFTIGTGRDDVIAIGRDGVFLEPPIGIGIDDEVDENDDEGEDEDDVAWILSRGRPRRVARLAE